MLKRLICFIFAFCTILNISVFALNTSNEFLVLGEDTEKICDVLKLTEKELSNICKENYITYFAINKNNTKQIKLTEKETEFSKKIGNLTHLSDDTALILTEEALIPEGVSGQVVNKNGQKFVKTEVETTDSGGKFIITNFITVSNKKLYTLSFYTKSSLDTSYIEDIFETFNEDGFYNEKEPSSPIIYVIWIGIILLIISAAFIIYTIIKDIKNP